MVYKNIKQTIQLHPEMKENIKLIHRDKNTIITFIVSIALLLILNVYDSFTNQASSSPELKNNKAKAEVYQKDSNQSAFISFGL